MSSPEPDLARRDDATNAPAEDAPSPGPNLWVVYCLIALALAAAMGITALIVRPFYVRH